MYNDAAVANVAAVAVVNNAIVAVINAVEVVNVAAVAVVNVAEAAPIYVAAVAFVNAGAIAVVNIAAASVGNVAAVALIKIAELTDYLPSLVSSKKFKKICFKKLNYIFTFGSTTGHEHLGQISRGSPCYLWSKYQSFLISGCPDMNS